MITTCTHHHKTKYDQESSHPSVCPRGNNLHITHEKPHQGKPQEGNKVSKSVASSKHFFIFPADVLMDVRLSLSWIAGRGSGWMDEFPVTQ